MKTTDEPQDNEEARLKRRARWQRRGLCTARRASLRFERAAAILLRASLNFQRAQRRARFPSLHIELGHLWEACDELYGGRPLRGIVLAREACEIARMMRPPCDGPGADYPLLSAEDIKAGYALARNFAASSKVEEENRQHRAASANACRKFFDVLGRLFREEERAAAVQPLAA